MPAHDWTRVAAGAFHAFHGGWITHLQEALNDGVLPPDFYALAEQVTGNVAPDVLTLQLKDAPEGPVGRSGNGVSGTAVAPPRVSITAQLDSEAYARKARRLVIRHTSDDRIIALLEILSPGYKRTRTAMRRFVDKAYAALDQGYHLLLIDLFPLGPGDPQGVHGALWEELGGDEFHQPADKPLTLAAYEAERPITAYVEPFTVGDSLVDMPLFLESDWYVNVPVEATYQLAWKGVPKHLRDVLEHK